MKWITTVVINKRIANCWGTRAAAVFGWIFAQCQAQVPREECVRTACGRGVYRKVVRVRISCTQLGKLLHMSRHTVEAILHKLEAEGLLDVWLPRGEDRTRSYSIAPGASRSCTAGQASGTQMTRHFHAGGLTPAWRPVWA